MNEYNSYMFKKGHPFSTYFLEGTIFPITDPFPSMFSEAGSSEKVFPQSVVSGDPTSSGMILWTRVDPSYIKGTTAAQVEQEASLWQADQARLKAAAEEDLFVLLELSLTSDFTFPELQALAPVWKEHDYVVRIDTDTLLAANRTYYYRFITKSGYTSPIGRCQTLPEKDEEVKQISIGHVSCQDYTNGHFTAFTHLAAEDIAFFVHLGDYVYEVTGNADYQATENFREVDLPSGTPTAHTLEDYRQLYKTYRTDFHLQRLHERHAMVAVWDDHEYANDTFYPGVAPDDDPDPNMERRSSANQAWFEHIPCRFTYQKEKDSENTLAIYRHIEIGSLAGIYMMDERLYRDSFPCGNDPADRYFTEGCQERESSGRSMLGTPQRDWLLDKLSSSKSKWNIWGNQVQITQLKFLGRFINLDSWDGFPYERNTIARAIAKHPVPNFIALTGDFHTFEASHIQEHYRNGKSKAIGVEFMTGPISSNHLIETTKNYADHLLERVPLPIKQTADAVESYVPSVIKKGIKLPVTRLFTEFQNIIKKANPWIELFDSTSHGYAVLTLTETKADWKAYAVESIKELESPKSLLLHCEVPEGESMIRVLKKNSYF